MNTFNLRYFRERNEITQKEMSDILNISRSTYAGYENCIDNIPITKLNDLCEYFKISIDFLSGLSNTNNFISKKNLDPKEIGKRLDDFFNKNNITKTEIANLLNTSPQTIVHITKGRNFIQSLFLYEICKKYNVSMDYFLGKTDKLK